MARVTSLYETRKFYRQFIEITNPLTFEQWNSLPRSEKAIALYLQFFDQIVTAWDKANTIDFIDCEDGVDVINQYLEKNVPIIEADPKRFAPGYIYKIAYNCMYCICHDRKCDKERLENETSAIVSTADGEVDLLQLASNHKSTEDEYEESSFEKEFWSLIEDSGLEAEKVMRYLLSNNEADLKKLSKRNKNYSIDPLRDVEVSIEDAQSIVSKIREKLSSLPATSILGQKMLSLNISFN